jgi:replicative DNA helicase
MQQLIHRHDTGVERIVLATVLLNPEVLDTPDGLLPDTAFYSEAVRNLYRAATRVYRATGCCDVKLVGEDARRHGMRDAPLQLASVLADSDVMDSPTFCTAYFPAYVRELRRHYAARERSRATLTYQAALAKGQDETEARVVLDATLDAIDQLDPVETTDDEILHLLGSGARQETGVKPLDTLTGGMTRPGLNILAARPSTGKSALARNIIRHAAANGTTVFWYSIDQSIGQIYELEIAKHQRRSTITIRDMPETELRSAIRNIRRDVWRDRVTLIDKPLTLPVLLSHARSSGAGLIVIDYLQAVDTGVPSESEYDAVTRTSKALKALALEMGAPVLALSQLSRAAKNGEPPSLTHLRASGQIEQDADQVWGLERDTTDDSRASQEVTVHVLKNKTGPTGRARLTWHGKTASYEEWAPEGRSAGWTPQ